MNAAVEDMFTPAARIRLPASTVNVLSKVPGTPLEHADDVR